MSGRMTETLACSCDALQTFNDVLIPSLDTCVQQVHAEQLRPHVEIYL